MINREEPLKLILFTLVVVYVFVWIWLQLSPTGSIPDFYYDRFSDSYGVITLVSALIGLIAYKKWGGVKSIYGMSILLFSMGLFCQLGGQVSYAYYRMAHGVEVAYPSFGEIFYFGSIPVYIYATWNLLASLGGVKLIQKNKSQLAYLVLIAVAMLFFGYFLTLKDYEITDYGGPIKTAIGTILDYAYPFTQAILVSLAIYCYFLARKINGGMLQVPVIITVFAMYLQYLGDTLYTYRVLQGTYYGGDYTDLFYIGSYFLLGLAFLRLIKVHTFLLKNARSN